MARLVDKSRRLSGLFISLADEGLATYGLELVSPRNPSLRGSQVSYRYPEAYSISRAIVARGIIPDFRDPDFLRLGITLLYMGHVDVWDAVEGIRTVMAGLV